MLDLVPANLPKNVNGFRTTHTCELCGFEPKTKNKYREKQDHLVMKHFKEKIDKIFPHSRPYACPTAECGFQGKDKQALLRHYTGKHGILEKYLKEALAEKGISYVPGEHGSKRKHSDANGMPKLKKMMLTTSNGHHTNGSNGTTTILDPKDLLPKSPVPLMSTTIAQNTTNGVHRRPNTQELRNEVEAMMASLDPIPHQENVVTNGSSIVKVLPSLPSTPVPVSVATMEVNGVEKKTVILSNKTVQLQQQQQNNQQPTTILHQNSHGQIVQQIQQVHQQQQQQVVHHHQPATSVVSLVKRNDNTFMVSNGHNKQPTLILANGTKVQIASAVNGGQIHIPELILPEGCSEVGGNIHAIPIEVITTVASSNGHHVQNGVTNGDTCVVENEEVMWGATSSLGPNVVVEAVEPVTYIEEGGTQIVYSASLDNIDYDYLYPVTTTTATTSSTEATVRQSAVRERQLEFNML